MSCSKIRASKNAAGYVALEFVLAMGLLVLPTALVLLQIPGYLEKHDRVVGISAVVAQACANNATSTEQAQTLAHTSAQEELAASSSLRNASLVDASCSFEAGDVTPGSRVISTVAINVPAAVVPGMPSEATWTITSRHSVVVPKYRSFNKEP